MIFLFLKCKPLILLVIYFWLPWIFLFLAASGLSLVVVGRDYPLVTAHGLAITVASLGAEWGF